MLNRFRYILLFYIVLSICLNANAQIAMPDNVCVGLTKHYNVEPNIIPGSTYIWKIDGVIQVGAVSNEIDITWTNVGSYFLEVQEMSFYGCLGQLRTGQVYVSPMPEALANSNSPVCVGSAINLSAQTVIGASYLWGHQNGFSSSEQNPIISPAKVSDAGNYFLVISKNGCASDSVIVSVVINYCDDFDFFIPEGFSPNGDGINDLFVIRGIDHFPDNVFVIYNRWGDKIFESNSYKNTWDGKSTMGVRVGGDELPVGTYFYLLDLGDGSEVIKGTIFLNR